MIRVDIESIVMASGPVPSLVVLRERKSGERTSGAPLRALTIQTGAYEAAAIGHGVELAKQTQRPITHDLLLHTIKELGAKVERIEINRWDAPVFYADVVLAADPRTTICADGATEHANHTHAVDGAQRADEPRGNPQTHESAQTQASIQAQDDTEVSDRTQVDTSASGIATICGTSPTRREIKIDARPSDALALATRSNAPIFVEDDVMNRAGSISYQSAAQTRAEELEQFDAFVQNLSPDDF